MKKTVIKIIAFVCVFAMLFWGVDNVLRFKYSDGIRQIEQFYRQEDDSVDVLVVGSSHAFLNIYPEVLWRDFGYSSFNLAASLQPMWSSYHYIVEALKTQTPKVIILEGYRLIEQKDYVERGTVIKNLYGMKWSKNKLEAIKAATGIDKSESEDTRSPQEIAVLDQIPFEFANYHSRYSELSAADFMRYYGLYECKNYKGNVVGTKVYTGFKQPNVAEYSTEPGTLTAKTEEYYRKILELGRELDIPIVTVVAPFAMNNKEYSIYLAAEQISEEYGQIFVNYNEYYEEIGLDFSTDILDAGSHLNEKGAEKFTFALGELIQDNFDIPDHRGDDAYGSWETDTEEYMRLYGSKNGLTEITAPETYVQKMLDDGDYSFAVVVNGTQDGESSEAFDEQASALFEALDIGVSDICDGVWFFRDGELKYSNTSVDGFKKNYRLDQYSDIRLGYGQIAGATNENGEPVSAFYINHNSNEQIYYENALTVYTYDDFVHSYVDTFVYSFDGERQ